MIHTNKTAVLLKRPNATLQQRLNHCFVVTDGDEELRTFDNFYAGTIKQAWKNARGYLTKPSKPGERK